MMGGPTIRLLLDGMGWRSGLCARFTHAADDLIRTARQLNKELEGFKNDPNPIAALVSTVHNNQDFEKFLEHPTDTGTKPAGHNPRV